MFLLFSNTCIYTNQMQDAFHEFSFLLKSSLDIINNNFLICWQFFCTVHVIFMDQCPIVNMLLFNTHIFTASFWLLTENLHVNDFNELCVRTATIFTW